jgi:peptidoglycan/LPS O-acetylase OafA/YrhL
MIHAWNLNYHPSWNFPSWSISCEWLAYLSFPALAAVVALKWSRVSLWMFMALLLGGQLALNLIHDNDSSDWRLLSILFEFPTGVCLYQLYRLRNENKKRFRFLLQPGAALVLGATWAACGAIKAAHCVLIPLIALVLYSVAVDAQGFLSRILASRFACYWGRVSYSLYMTHAVTSMVLVRFTRLDNYIGCHLTVRLGMCIIYFGTLAAVAALVYHTIEEPARRQMRRIYPK